LIRSKRRIIAALSRAPSRLSDANVVASLALLHSEASHGRL
jgi:hypothetical protein